MELESSANTSRGSYWTRATSFWSSSRVHPNTSTCADELYNAAAMNTTEEFSDLDNMGFIVTGSFDKNKRPAVFVIAKHYQAAVMNPDLLFRYMVHKLHSLTEQPYVLVWVHTDATYWENCPSIQWMWRTYERLPARYRDNLHRLYVVHCDAIMWASMWAICPWMSQQLWAKVEWVSRLEFLWDIIDQAAVTVPEFVKEHDQLLEENPLIDYGIVASGQGMMMPTPLPFPTK